jgi:protein-tyrosine phosphatase
MATDLHFHLLPGVDDGPASLEASLELASAAAADGTDTIVATPHVRAEFVMDTLSLPLACARLQAAIDALGIPVRVVCGGELAHDMAARLTQPELEAIAVGPPDARWILLETPFAGVGEDFHAAADELRDRGFGVVLAHPERSSDAALDDSAALRRELAAGALAQINAGSLTGAHGAAAERAGHALVREGLATVVGSDAHGPTRPPALRAAAAALLDAGVDGGRVRTLVSAGPKRLLARGVPRAEMLVA